MMSPGKRKVLATFAPESAKPAVFAVLEWEEGGVAINRKQFYRVCTLCQHASGSAALIASGLCMSAVLALCSF